MSQLYLIHREFAENLPNNQFKRLLASKDYYQWEFEERAIEYASQIVYMSRKKLSASPAQVTYSGNNYGKDVLIGKNTLSKDETTMAQTIA